MELVPTSLNRVTLKIDIANRRYLYHHSFTLPIWWLVFFLLSTILLLTERVPLAWIPLPNWDHDIIREIKPQKTNWWWVWCLMWSTFIRYVCHFISLISFFLNLILPIIVLLMSEVGREWYCPCHMLKLHRQEVELFIQWPLTTSFLQGVCT